VAAREIDGLTNRAVVHDNAPPALSVTELDYRDLVDRPCKDTGCDLVVLGCLMRLGDLVVEAAR
jgi:hypothetical protein